MSPRTKTTDVEGKIDQLGENAEAVLDETKETIAQAQSALEKAREALGEGYGKLKSRSTEAYTTAKEYLADARASLEAAREKTGELYGRSRETAEELYEKTKVQFEKLSAEVKKGYSKVRARVDEVDVKEVRDDVVEYIRQNPGKAVLIALGVGFALGFMMRHREP